MIHQIYAMIDERCRSLIGKQLDVLVQKRMCEVLNEVEGVKGRLSVIQTELETLKGTVEGFIQREAATGPIRNTTKGRVTGGEREARNTDVEVSATTHKSNR